MKSSVVILLFVGMLLLCSFAEGLGPYSCRKCKRVSCECAILVLGERPVRMVKYTAIIWFHDFDAQTSLFT